jgi:hypothetical protein
LRGQRSLSHAVAARSACMKRDPGSLRDYPKPVRSMVRQALKKRSKVGW